MDNAQAKCPECRSSRIWKDGLRYARNGEIQRYVCRECGHRFSETGWNGSEDSERVQKVHSKILCSFSGLRSSRQICASELKGARNLAEVESRTEKRAAGATKVSKADIKGKIVEYLWYLKKKGYAELTVRLRVQILKRLARHGVNLLDPEQVRHILATHDDWNNNYKQTIVSAYGRFVEMLGIKWEPPNYRQIRELPFIPLERELDALIAGCGKKAAASLQLLKETGMRIGEAWRLRWTDLDEEKRTIRCRAEKGGNPRMFKVSNKLIAMLNALPKTSKFVFGGTSLNAHRKNFMEQRKRLAWKLQNPRLNQISFHTFRHWKATMEYHRTRDILHVKELLGHRNINSTLVYTHLISFEDDEFHVRVAKTLKEACDLIEAGFDYVTDMDEAKIFRKRK